MFTNFHGLDQVHGPYSTKTQVLSLMGLSTQVRFVVPFLNLQNLRPA